MAERAVLAATATTAPSAKRLAELSEMTDVLEIRADLAGDLDPTPLRAVYAGRLLYTLRSRAQGGAGPNDSEQRRQRLHAAVATGYDLVDLEHPRDLGAETLAGVPAGRRVVSWHGPPQGFRGLVALFDEMVDVAAELYKIVPHAAFHGQEIEPLALVRSVERSDVLGFATGRIGAWTRLVAPRLGAPWIFGSSTAEPAAPGQPSIDRLVADYGLPELRRAEELFGVAGRPVADSLSPRLHNEAYRRTGIEALYVAFHVESFADFWLEVVEGDRLSDLGLPLAGLSVTTPGKRLALALAGAASPLAVRVGSANTLVFRDGVWEAETTDCEGAIGPLASREVVIKGRPTAVLGAGGAGRAAAFALARAGARVTLFNRDLERLEEATRDLDLPGEAWSAFDPSQFAIVVHATPLGRFDADELPFSPDRLAIDAVVEDLAYLPEGPTALVQAVRATGRVAIDGREVLLYQAVPQFEAMTDRSLPLDLARQILELREPA